MSEKKKKPKIGLIILGIILLSIVVYFCYVNGVFNGLFSKFGATKDLVVVDLDTSNRKDENYQEYTLSNGMNAEYYYDEDGKIEIVELKGSIDESKMSSTTLTAIKAATKAVKGVKFESEEVNGKLEIDLTVAPSDVPVELIDKAVDAGIINSETASSLKSALNNLDADSLNKILENINY